MAQGGNFWGKLVIQLRDEQKLSQRQLSAGAKVNRSTLRRIEDGTARGDIEIMERLLNYMGYELEAMTEVSLAQRLKLRARQVDDPNQRSKLAVSRIMSMQLQ
jgi:transcriptional regulator with XRE-family HTH domain